MTFAAIPETLRADLAPEPLPIAEAWRELLGNHVPEDLARHEPQDGGFLLNSPVDLLSHENCFEAAVEMATSVVEPVLQVLTSTFFLTEIPSDGDCLMVQIPNHGDTSQIVVWSHEQGFFTGPVAWDIPTALRVMEVYGGYKDPEGRAKKLEPALGRVDAHQWPFSYISERLVEEGVLSSYDLLHSTEEPPRALLPVVQPRAMWIAWALSGHLSDPESFRGQLDWTPEAALGGPHLPNYSPTALYWLWRSYFLNEAWLDDIIKAIENSPSRLVRDATKLVKELQAGTRTEVGGRNVTVIKEKILAQVAKMLNPYPEELKSGFLNFVRDDSKVAILSTKPEPNPNPPACAAGQLWEPQYAANGPALVVSPQGRFLVQGARKHPRAGKESAPNWINSVFEVDSDGYIRMTVDAEQIKFATYITDDLFLMASTHWVRVYERMGKRGFAIQDSGNNVQDFTLFANGGRTVVRIGGFYSYDLQKQDARSLQVYRIDGADLKLMSLPELAVGEAVIDGMTLIVGNTEAGVAYTADLSVLQLEDLTSLHMKPSRTIRPSLPAREGPQVALDQLNDMTDWAFQMPDGTCCILKHNGDGFDYWIGDDQGARPFEPALGGKSVSCELIDDSLAAFIVENSVIWLGDFKTGKATPLFETEGSDVAFLWGIADRGFVQVLDGDLVLHRPGDSGYTQTRIPLGEGAALVNAIADGRIIIVKAAGSPLVALGVDGDKIRLLGAIDPQGPFGQTTAENFENPRFKYRVELVAADKNRFSLRAIDAVLERVEDYPVIEALPPTPWVDCPIGD